MTVRYLCSILLAVFLAASMPLAAVQEHCAMDEPLASLDDCVTHHYEAGEIATRGVYISLLAKAQVAQAAVAAGHDDVAVRVLEAFIRQVEALSGRQVTGSAVHLAHHAEMAIDEIANP